MFKKLILAAAAAITLAVGLNAPASAAMSLAQPAVGNAEVKTDVIKVGRRFGGFRRGGFRRSGFRHRGFHRRHYWGKRYYWRKRHYWGKYHYWGKRCFWRYGYKYCKYFD